MCCPRNIRYLRAAAYMAQLIQNLLQFRLLFSSGILTAVILVLWNSFSILQWMTLFLINVTNVSKKKYFFFSLCISILKKYSKFFHDLVILLLIIHFLYWIPLLLQIEFSLTWNIATTFDLIWLNLLFGISVVSIQLLKIF